MSKKLVAIGGDFMAFGDEDTKPLTSEERAKVLAAIRVMWEEIRKQGVKVLPVVPRQRHG